MFSLIVGSVREIRRIFITIVGFTICNINLIEYLILGLKGRSLDQHADRREILWVAERPDNDPPEY